MWVVLLAVLLGAPACSSDPDLVALGAARVTGTEGAAYLGGRPFSLSPDGRYLLFALEFEAPVVDDDPLGYVMQQLAAYRLLELAAGRLVEIDPPGTPLRERLARLGLIADSGCWTRTSDRLALRTPFRDTLVLEVTAGQAPHWNLLERAPETLLAGCREPLPPTGDLRRGPFSIERSTPGRLVVRRAAAPAAVLFEVQARGMRDLVLLEDTALAPGGQRLALAYAAASGSFVGRVHGVLIGAEPGVPVTPLGGGVRKLAWAADGSALYGYGRADSTRAYAIYRWTQ